MKLYSFKGEYIKEVYVRAPNLTGIVEWADGSKTWFMNGKQHRLDGPAVEWANGAKQYYINDQKIKCHTNEQFKLLVDIMKLKGLI